MIETRTDKVTEIGREMNASLEFLFEAFEQQKVLIVGDVMLDHYVSGSINRISPEAPIPIVDVGTVEHRLGGAANVAANIKNLGARPILVSIIGDDREGRLFLDALKDAQIDAGGIRISRERQTTVKTRVLSRGQQLLRYDRETAQPINEQLEILLIDSVIDYINDLKPEVVIFQDYNKGVLTKKVIANLMHYCNRLEIPTAVDPKFDNFFEYKGCSLFKPNLKEVSEALNWKCDTSRRALKRIAEDLMTILRHQCSIITLSEKGIFIHNEETSEIVPAYGRSIVDVSGAGDTVISVLALGLSLNINLTALAELANLAAALVCEQTGVVPVPKEQLLLEAKKIIT